jgi:MFS family permease
MDNKKYNVFLLISNMARNIVDIFSLIILYEAGISITNIFKYLSIYYFFSIIINIFSIYFLNKFNYKVLLIISSLMLGISFSYLSIMKFTFNNLLILAFLLSISNYTFHTVRHYLGIKFINNRKEVSISLIFSYIGIMISSYLGAYITDNYSIIITTIIVLTLSIISIIPLSFINNKLEPEKINITNVKLNNLLFVILEQFKVIFLLLEPLYLYLFIDNKLEYIGIFNIFIGISSIFFIYLIGKKKNIIKNFKWLNILFTIVLILKININNKFILLVIAFLEGIGIKNFEIASIENFYKINKSTNISSYLMISEVIFCLTSSIITLIFSFINNLIISMYICIGFIFICSFIRYKKI